MSIEKDKWNECVETQRQKCENLIKLGLYTSYLLNNSPRRLLFQMSYYKFAAKIIGEGKSVFEVGCNEGFGTIFLNELAEKVVACDIDKEAIEFAKKNFGNKGIRFIESDFLEHKNEFNNFDAFVSFDTIEHISCENESIFYENICKIIKNDGICIIGTPNITSNVYASEITKKAHINLYNWERLKQVTEKYFRRCMLFSANDEIVHTGFYPMAHYLIAVGIGKIDWSK